LLTDVQTEPAGPHGGEMIVGLTKSGTGICVWATDSTFGFGEFIGQDGAQVAEPGLYGYVLKIRDAMEVPAT
jgi:hypothetical protein